MHFLASLLSVILLIKSQSANQKFREINYRNFLLIFLKIIIIKQIFEYNFKELLKIKPC